MIERRCPGCGETKSLDAFGWRNKARGLRQCYCKPCTRAQHNRYYALKSSDERAATVERYRLVNRESSLRRKYGISLADYAEMYEQQGGKCAMCGADGTTLATSKRGCRDVLVVDHDHSTGRVRGLLCSPCNVAIGALRENPALFATAIVYLSGRRVVHAQQEQGARLIA